MARSEKIFVPRFVTERLKDGTRSEPHPLSHWRATPAYVLLGDPGAGKTTALTEEAQECAAQVVSVTDVGFVQTKKSTKAMPYFIDALDEKRAGGSDADALNAIRMALVKLKNPSFRITCREIDWLGGVDTNALKAVSPNGEITELHLEPLTDDNIEAMLVNWPDVLPTPDVFWKHATQHGLQSWLRNPMALELFVKAVLNGGQGRMPDSRREIFELACRQLATEFNAQHLAGRRRAQPTVDDTLEDAGKMFAILLLSNADGLASTSQVADAPGRIIALNEISSGLGIKNEAATRASLLFTTQSRQSTPYHRTIAEYLGAVAIGKWVDGGLPVSRVLALMSGQDGGIVEPLRGLHAWMAVTCPSERIQLSDRDPLGVVMYGDVRGFSTTEKQRIFEALAREANRYAWFRGGIWNSHPFGALGTLDMVPVMRKILSNPDRGMSQQSMIDCAVDAIRYGDDLPQVLPDLERIFRDAALSRHSRIIALKAWLVQAKSDIHPALEWLNEITEAQIEDPDYSLRAVLLQALYPAHITPGEIASYYTSDKKKELIGAHWAFWAAQLFNQTPQGRMGELADSFSALNIDRRSLYLDFRLQQTLGKVIEGALNESDHTEAIPRILTWLRAGRGAHSDVALKDGVVAGIATWLGQNPGTLKKIYAQLCLESVAETEGNEPHFWTSDQFLYGAKKTTDWFNWLLTLAEATDSENLARFYVQCAARAALAASVDFSIRIEDVKVWLRQNLEKWPQAQDWVNQIWVVPLTNHHSEFAQRERKYQLDRDQAVQRRRQSFNQQMVDITNGTVNVGVLHALAGAYKNRYSDISGESPQERLQDLTGGDASDVKEGIRLLRTTLDRNDLPMVEEILTAGRKGEEHLIRPACLVAAELGYSESPDNLNMWGDELLRCLVAFWLTDGTENEPEWYSAAIRIKPALVAGVMLPYAIGMIRKNPAISPTGIWALARNDGLAELARLVIPGILLKFPVRSNEQQFNRLVDELLPAALKHLEPSKLAGIVKTRLQNTRMDAGQRVAWLAMGVFQGSRVMGTALAKFVGGSQSKARQLMRTVNAQFDREMKHLRLTLETKSLLIELLCPQVVPANPVGLFWVGPSHHGREYLRGMVNDLAGSSDGRAVQELQRLRTLPQLKAWWLELDSAIFENTRLARSAHFTHASPQAVALTLAKLAPAGAADLQALVIDQLERVGKEVRGSANNVLDQFWTDKLPDVSRKSQIENVCRDRLKQLLQNRLQLLNVSLDKESYAAGDKRMDLRAAISVDGKRRMVPIEIKKESHTNVWTAWRDQLDKQYLNEPDTEGYGIYLVLWFGLTPKAFEGVKPKNATEMSTMLRDRIPSGDQFRIAVVVMDLSLEPVTIKSEKKALTKPSQRLFA